MVFELTTRRSSISRRELIRQSLCGSKEDLGFSTAHTIWTPFNHEHVDKCHSSKQSDVSCPGWWLDLHRDKETTQEVQAVHKICGPQSSGSCLAEHP